ncbi:hypothetical protein [Halarchaeum sp. P4]|uniref:hypothetical protein n=1 Tax=Halarchaeum sp. P4 TaxID=3421639 RepID=UPI003EBCA617
MAATDDLPVLADDARTYVRIRPSRDGITPGAFATQVRRLHDLLTPPSKRVRHTPPQLLEVLIVVDAAGECSYVLGATGDVDTTILERTLRALFPPSYELEHLTRAPRWLTTLDDGTDDIAAVEYRGTGRRPNDWQLRLTPAEAFVEDEHATVPLATVVDVLATRESPSVFQVLVRPKPDWTHAAAEREGRLERLQDTMRDQVLEAVWPRDPETERTLPARERTRLDELRARDTHTSFEVAARAVALGPGAESTAEALQSALAAVSGTHHRITGRITTDRRARRVFDEIVARSFPTRRLHEHLPGFRTTWPHVVADAHELASFVALDGTGLTTTGARTLAPTPDERRKRTRPPTSYLERYHTPGLTLGHPLDEDGHPDVDPVSLPPALQRMHCVWIGKSGAGKTTALTSAALANAGATRGANIVIEPKGDGMATDYLRAHYATHGTLDDVHYFDCQTLLPALSILDIRPDLAVGRERADAVTDRVDHVMDLLRQLMGAERFDAAVRSPTVIRYGLRAAFDPVHGDDVIGLDDLHALLQQMHASTTPPPTVDATVQRSLDELVETTPQTFDQIMGGAATRIEHLSASPRLNQLFTHTPDEDDPVFRFDDYLDTQATLVFDLGGLREQTKRGLSLVLVSLLWSALKRRTHRAVETGENERLPLVNLYIEEAASIAGSTTLASVLREGRAFDVSVTLATQYPGQLRSRDPDLYRELLNDVSTLVVGNVGLDPDLAARLATSDEDPAAVATRLRALRRGEWLCSLPADFDQTEPHPFVVRSTPLPLGHPDGDHPLTTRQRTAFERTLARRTTQVEARVGRRFIGDYATDPVPAAPSDDDAQASSEPETTPRLDSLLPYTRRLPAGIAYDTERHAVRCRTCDATHAPTLTGVRDAITCCGSLEDTDRDDIPVTECHLKLTPAELAESEYSHAQLRFLQVVWNAQARRLHPLEYDVRRDSMIRLREYTGIDTDDVNALVDADLLTDHGRYPHQLYSLTPAGRDAIGEHNRTGLVHGDRQGDLGETTQHVMLVDLARDYLHQASVQNPDSPVTRIEPYYELADGHRLDIAGLDDEDNIVLTVEAERINHDLATAVLDDYDKMAALNPTDAIWVAVTQPAAARILDALHDPADDEPRIPHTYGQTTSTRSYRYNTPGLTDVYTAHDLQKHLFANN